MPTPSYIGDTVSGTDASIGLGSEEVGVLIGDASYTVDNPRIEFMDRFAGVIGEAVNFNPLLTQEFSAEVLANDSGLITHTYTAAASLANDGFFEGDDGTYNGIDFSTGTLLLGSAAGAQPRGEKRTIDYGYFKRPGLTITPPP